MLSKLCLLHLIDIYSKLDESIDNNNNDKEHISSVIHSLNSGITHRDIDILYIEIPKILGDKIIDENMKMFKTK
jgi:hypothetical protein